eukprot:TRINITY_DN6424_c0_g1_i2.p1 TRINITY_DN6424_c0_g1~~TRINITY_DN6424_c0_g1_i2.p1  ORF type:complete len:111 (-),score=19.82 TRINITY_DN6424_c0_g1_i2:130-462(-)
MSSTLSRSLFTSSRNALSMAFTKQSKPIDMISLRQQSRFFASTTKNATTSNDKTNGPKTNPTQTQEEKDKQNINENGEYVNPKTGEIGGPRGPEPTRYGDWERKGRAVDF